MFRVGPAERLEPQRHGGRDGGVSVEDARQEGAGHAEAFGGVGDRPAFGIDGARDEPAGVGGVLHPGHCGSSSVRNVLNVQAYHGFTTTDIDDPEAEPNRPELWHSGRDKGEPFEIEFLSVDSAYQRTLLPYLGTLKLLGISGGIRLVDAAQFVNLRQVFDYDAIVTQNDILAPPIVFLCNFFHSRSASQTQSFTASGIADPVFDALIAEAVKVTTLEEMATACRALDRVLLWGFYQIPLDAIAPFRIVYWNKFGRPEREDMAVYKSPFPDGWWYDETKAAQIEISR